MDRENSGATNKAPALATLQGVHTVCPCVASPPPAVVLGEFGHAEHNCGQAVQASPFFREVTRVVELTCKCYFYCLWFISKKQRKQR